MNENMIKETNWKIHKKETEIKMWTATCYAKGRRTLQEITRSSLG
jgi:hypothetical protein